MPITFVTATTGGGKGVYCIRKIKDALDKGKKVATNMDLFLEHICDKHNHNAPIRLPDSPSAEHMYQIGYGSPEDNKNKDDYGLLVLDEISLFLDTKQRKEFSDLMAWFVQRRKFHWDILFIAQSKDQVQETIYKALCDNLVVCKAKDLVPIPYIGSMLASIGLKGMLPEGHISFKFNGRNETDPLMSTAEYKNHPYRKMYDTDQKFKDGFEYLNGHSVDMRAIYTYLPASVLTMQKYIDHHIDRIKTINQIKNGNFKKDKDMKTNIGGGLAFKMKAGALILVVIGIFVFNNPMDSALFGGNGDISVSDQQPQKIPLISEAQPKEPEPDVQVNTLKDPKSTDDFFEFAFNNYDHRVDSLVKTNGQLIGFVSFYDNGIRVDRLSFSDISANGFKINRDRSTLTFVHSETGKKYVSSTKSQPLVTIDSSSKIEKRLPDSIN